MYNATAGMTASSQSSVSDREASNVNNIVASLGSGDPDVPELPLSKKMKLIQKHTVSSQGNWDARL